jgi:xanthine dehydrogenase accessory factor
MWDIFSDLERWFAEGKSVALATVIRTWNSSPRGVGAKMAMTPEGNISGSVSGGCVEAAVYQAGVETLKTGRPQLLHFGVADETAWEVGLACGGSIDVFIGSLEESLFQSLSACIQGNKPLVVAMAVRGPDNVLGQSLLVCDGVSVYNELDEKFKRQSIEVARKCLSEERSQQVQLTSAGEEKIDLFFDVMLPSPTLVIVGGVHIAITLSKIAKVLGYRTILVDPRAAFGNLDRFPHVDELIQEWPKEAFAKIELDRATAVTVLTHDPKIDDPALKITLSSPAFYIGVLGSQNTQAKRRKRLMEAGVSELQLNRLHGPIGLDIGAETPEEIALAVMAEIVVESRGKLL